MKKVAVMGSENGDNFEAIVKYFAKKDVEIVCLSDRKDANILAKAEKSGIENCVLPIEQNFDYFSQNEFDLIALDGYGEILSKEVLDKMGKVINIHPSILPAFKGKDAVKKAFLAGVKLSGITIYWVEEQVNEGKIIAQYPVFIDNAMRFDEFESEIKTIERKLYPIVIEKILEDKVFDFQDLMKSSCNNKGCGGHSSDSSNSGGCRGCH